MAKTVTIYGLSRNRIRVGTQVLTSKATITVDLDDAKVRRDLAHHNAIGQYIVVT